MASGVTSAKILHELQKALISRYREALPQIGVTGRVKTEAYITGYQDGLRAMAHCLQDMGVFMLVEKD